MVDVGSVHILAEARLFVWMLSVVEYVSGGRLPRDVRRGKSTEEKGGRLPDIPAYTREQELGEDKEWDIQTHTSVGQYDCSPLLPHS